VLFEKVWKVCRIGKYRKETLAEELAATKDGVPISADTGGRKAVCKDRGGRISKIVQTGIVFLQTWGKLKIYTHESRCRRWR
jgi:hypothetical protein